VSERGGATFTSNVGEVLREMDRVGMQRLTSAAIIARNVIVESFSGPRTGRWYAKPYTKTASYQASALGERPAKPTGVLAGAVGWGTAKDISGFSAYVGIPARAEGGIDLGYGIALELMPGKGRRPWLVPGMKEAKPAILAELGREWF